MKNRQRKFLIINPFGIGDVLFSSPLIRNIREWQSDARIYYLCNKRVAPLLAHHPLLDRIFVYERDDFEEIRMQSWYKWICAMVSFLNTIRRERIDIAFDLSLNTKFGFFSMWAGIPTRIGFDFKGRGRLLTHKYRIDGFTHKHVADYYLDLLTLWDIPIASCQFELFLSAADTAWAQTLCKKKGFLGQRIVSIAPCGGESFGTRGNVKRWPLDNFAAVINMLVDRFKVRVCILAGPNEKQEVDQLVAQIKQRDKVLEATSYSITQVAALVAMSELVISNDTGPLRFANALAKKTVALFGPVDERVYGLYPANNADFIVLAQQMSCRPCYNRFRLAECTHDSACLQSITVDEVLAATETLLNRK